MRLINADKLHYHRVWIASIKKGEYNGMKSAVVVFADEIDKNKKARVDAVPVVRCKDCKHWSRMCDESYLGEPGLGKCRNERFFAFEYGFETEDNFTCADGKRKGGDE